MEVLFAIFILFPLISSDVPTEVTVLNSPPYLQKPIPDQAWPKNTNLINAFDLDDYFIDPNGDELNYTFTNLINITVFIDPIDHQVSFYPDYEFIGKENITFYASDGNYTVLSNPVSLFVGYDNESPTWHSPTKSKANIYQNDVVNFSMVWKDNVALSRYVFSINQGSGWLNYSEVLFSGTQNISLSSAQISAPGGSIVYWMVYAWDTSENLNVSEIQSFNVSLFTGGANPPEEEEGGKGTGTGGKILEAIEGLELFPKRKSYDFRLNLYEIKLSLKQDSSKTILLKITNMGTEELSFNLEDLNLWNFVVFSKKDFSLLPGISKDITIDFVIPKEAYVGQYYGFINVNTIKLNKTIPVVLDIKAIDIDFDVSLKIPEKYKSIRPGKEITSSIHIYNIKDISEVNASLYYAIKDFFGGIYNFSEEQVFFTNSIDLNKSLQIPFEAKEGKYIFYVRVSDGKNIAIDSDTFEVGKKLTLESFLKTQGIFIFVFLTSFFLAIFMVKYQRDRKKERLINLYMNLTKLKQLIKLNKQEEALQLFLKIRLDYKEPLSQELLEDKEKLKQELSKLCESINPSALKKIQEESSLKTPPVQTPKQTPPTKLPTQNNPIKPISQLKIPVQTPKQTTPTKLPTQNNPIKPISQLKTPVQTNKSTAIKQSNLQNVQKLALNQISSNELKNTTFLNEKNQKEKTILKKQEVKKWNF